jgi:nucleoside-diphosphate-sugar epimerase
MVHNSKNDGIIKLYIKHLVRAILGTKDLCRAFEAIIDAKDDRPGIYNLSSFNGSAEEIAREVSRTVNVPITEYNIDSDISNITNIKVQTNTNNIAIDTTKFEKNFNFKFNDTISSIATDVITGYNSCNKTSRDYHIKYA